MQQTTTSKPDIHTFIFDERNYRNVLHKVLNKEISSFDAREKEKDRERNVWIYPYRVENKSNCQP